MMIWDLRKRQTVYTIPAHTNLISHVKFHGKACSLFLFNPLDPYNATVHLVIYHYLERRIFNSLLVFFSFFYYRTQKKKHLDG